MDSPIYQAIARDDDNEDDDRSAEEKKEEKVQDITADDIKEGILRMFDGDNNLAIQELTDEDITKMIQTQKEYQKFGKLKCGHTVLLWASKNKLMIFNVLFLVIGLMVAEFMLKQNWSSRARYEQVWFYTVYIFLIILCMSVTRLVVYLIMKVLYICIKNTWKVFYIKDIEGRLFLAILCILWFVTFAIFGEIYDYDYNENIYKIVNCVWITSTAFLVSYVMIKWIALHHYFDVFKQRARKLKAYAIFMKIMLDLPPDNGIFTNKLMNFLIDFPTYKQTVKARQTENIKYISFGFSTKNIDIINGEITQILEMAKEASSQDIDLSKINNDAQIQVVEDLFDSDLYSIDLSTRTPAIIVINKEKLTRLATLLSYLIIIRLNQIKNDKILTKKDEPISSQKKAHDRNGSLSVIVKTIRGAWSKDQLFSAAKLNIDQVENNQNINEYCFIQAFKEYDVVNKRLLTELGKLAWKKFRDNDNDMLNAQVLSMNIATIIDDLLNLKVSIDSYVVIIRNLQQMVDVLTPILLLFVYLYMFNLDFSQTLTLYVSSVGIIGFFGASYFSSIIASLSFIIALNPFLVGDKIYLDNDFYAVREISLISCVFENLRTGWFHTFQNKLLANSKKPVVNLSRSKTMRYRWVLYFKSCVDNKFLYKFTEACSNEISQLRDAELKILFNNRHNKQKNRENIQRNSYCTFSELKMIDFESVVFKAVKLDEYGRKCVFMEMKYQTFSWNVNTLCFNCITSVANKDEYKQYLCDHIILKM